jgi:PIN domain nuclease of toxin-antitoxin system
MSAATAATTPPAAPTIVWNRWPSACSTRRAPTSVGDAENDCYVSLVSAWEMTIKCATGQLKLAVSVQRYYQEHLPANDFQLLPIDLGHATLVETLPLHHRDPFDRLLIAQAWQEGLTPTASTTSTYPSAIKPMRSRAWHP